MVTIKNQPGVVIMATATGGEGQPARGGKVAGWLRKVFELNPAGVNWPRAVLFLDVALVPLVVFWAIGYKQYLFSALSRSSSAR
jgi:hypothetical protein